MRFRTTITPVQGFVMLAVAAIVVCLVWALAAASAGGSIFPPDPPPPPYPQPIVICHESRVVPSTPTHGIGSTVTCVSHGVAVTG